MQSHHPHTPADTLSCVHSLLSLTRLHARFFLAQRDPGVTDDRPHFQHCAGEMQYLLHSHCVTNVALVNIEPFGLEFCGRDG
jgi:hypothetical protein